MRRFGVLGIALMASGCSGFGDFVGDVFTFEEQPNRPVGNSENMQRTSGVEPPVEALTTEPGNIWPGPVKLQPSLLNVLGNQTTGGTPGGAGLPSGLQNPALPAPGAPLQPVPGPTGRAPGSAAPELNFPGLPKANVPYAPSPGANSPPLSRVPKSPAGLPANDELTTKPVTIDNGNGTSTIINPDGSIKTVPNSSLKQP